MEKESGAKYVVASRTLIVALPQEVDDYLCEGIRKEIARYFENYDLNRIIFDFGKTKFMDSSGIGLLLYFYKILKGQDGEILLYGEDIRMEKILRMSGMYQIMKHTNKKN